jgi:hypothetical protein
MEDRDLALMVLMAPAMDTDTVEAMDTDTVEAMDTEDMEEAEVATLGAVEVAVPKDPGPGLWSLPASATVRAKTPKWRTG